ncbi:MAG: PIG-L deacetylase family protein [Fimbriimonadales bacterium]
MIAGIFLFAGFVLLVRAEFGTRATEAPANMVAGGEAMMGARRVVAVVAHPDDAEYWISGTLSLLGKAGARVVLVVASNGEKGPNKVGAANLALARKEEQLAAGRIMGYGEILFLDLPDRSVVQDRDLNRKITHVLLRENADLVITFDGLKPQMPYLHPDHEALGRVARSAALELGTKPALYLFHTRRPNTAVDISSVGDAKIAAFAAHRSQHGGGHRGGPVKANRASGARYGLPPAELFRAVRQVMR